MAKHPLGVSYRFGRCELQASERRLLMAGKPVALAPRAFDLLVALVERAGRLATKDELLERVWPKLVVEENNLQQQVTALRKVLGAAAIDTVVGHGYRFTPTVKRCSDSKFEHLEHHNETLASIAVLPFANVGDDLSNEYFAEGLSEELLNVLAQIRGLHVASRTSAFYFKGKDFDLPTIAQKLNVATVLEGSVRRAGNRVRITVQLIHTGTNAQLWAETYDRELEDIFAVQDDIARAVVTELRVVLAGEQPKTPQTAHVEAEINLAAKGRAEDVELHRLYLEGRFSLERQTPESVAKGIELLQRAVELDPGYALAWAALSRGYLLYAHPSSRTAWVHPANGPGQRAFDLARTAAARAQALQPDLPDACAVLGWVRMLVDWDWSGARESIQRALELAPRHGDAIRYASLLALNLGDTDEALELHQRALTLDPLSHSAWCNLGNYYLGTGFPDKAAVAVEKAVELNPHAELLNFIVGQTRLAQKRPNEALAAFQRMGGALRLLGIALAHFAGGERYESEAALRQLMDQYAEHGAFQIAEIYAYRHELDLSFLWLERAYQQHAAELCQVKWDPLLQNLHGDPRWLVFLERMGLARLN